MYSVIFDLDGTLANADHRLHHLESRPKDWDSFYQDCDKDEPIIPTIRILEALNLYGYCIEIWTGRSEVVERKTREWLNKHILDTRKVRLLMRRKGDYRHDTVIKKEWYENGEARGKVVMVFEDRKRVVDMWRSLGIQCYQVDNGNF